MRSRPGGGRALFTRPYAWVWAVLTVWAVGWGAFAGRESVLFSWGFFVKAGSVLFGGGPEGGLHFYHAHPELQFGPVATLLAAPFVALPHPIGGYAVIGLMSLAGAVAIAQGVALLPAPRRSLADGPDASDLPAGPRTLLLAGLLVIPVWSELSVHIGHLDDVIAVVAILAALHAVLQAQPVPAGLLVAIAIDAKPWVLPAAVVLLAVPGVRRALVACAAGVAVAWAPFVIADPATITSAGTFRIPVVAGSALRVLGVHDRLTPAWCRPTQALLGLLIAGVLVWRGAIAPLCWPCWRRGSASIRRPISPTAAARSSLRWPLIGPSGTAHRGRPPRCCCSSGCPPSSPGSRRPPRGCCAWPGRAAYSWCCLSP